MSPLGPSWANKKMGRIMKTISSIVADRAFKAITTMSCFGLAVSLCMVAFGMDLNPVWL